MSSEQIQFERVDGRDYAVGSVEHKQALDRKIERTRTQFARSEIGERFDANQTAFLAGDLVFVEQDAMKILYQRLQAAEFIPVRSRVPRGAQTWGYRMIDQVGEAKAGAHLKADDHPQVDVAIEEVLHKVTHVTASYSYSLDELEYAAFSGTPLQREKANAAAEIIARKLDKLMRVGDPLQGITGFFNNPNVPILTLTNGEWDSTATVDEIKADWAEIEQTFIDQSLDVHSASRLVLPTTMEGELRQRVTGVNSDVRLSDFLVRDSRMLREIRRWIALDSATGTDVTVADPPLGIAYDPDPENVFAEIPIPFESLPPQARNFHWVVPCRAVFGGVVFKRPLSALYIENLD